MKGACAHAYLEAAHAPLRQEEIEMENRVNKQYKPPVNLVIDSN